MTNHHQRFPIQVLVRHRRDDGTYEDERLWSHHKKNDDNALRAYKEAVRDWPAAKVRIVDSNTGTDLTPGARN